MMCTLVKKGTGWAEVTPNSYRLIQGTKQDVSRTLHEIQLYIYNSL